MVKFLNRLRNKRIQKQMDDFARESILWHQRNYFLDLSRRAEFAEDSEGPAWMDLVLHKLHYNTEKNVEVPLSRNIHLPAALMPGLASMIDHIIEDLEEQLIDQFCEGRDLPPHADFKIPRPIVCDECDNCAGSFECGWRKVHALLFSPNPSERAGAVDTILEKYTNGEYFEEHLGLGEHPENHLSKEKERKKRVKR